MVKGEIYAGNYAGLWDGAFLQCHRRQYLWRLSFGNTGILYVKRGEVGCKRLWILMGKCC